MAKEDSESKDERQESPEDEEETGENEDREEGDYSELKERMLRLAAEFDNYKKRAKKELESAETIGKASLIKDMLPTIDEFELAMLAISDSKDGNIAKGIEMLYTNLMSILKKEGLSEIDTNGGLDPYKHEVIMVKQSDKEDGTILEIVRKGYMFKDRLLRPASVIIAKNESLEGNDEETEE